MYGVPLPVKLMPLQRNATIQKSCCTCINNYWATKSVTPLPIIIKYPKEHFSPRQIDIKEVLFLIDTYPYVFHAELFYFDGFKGMHSL